MNNSASKSFAYEPLKHGEIRLVNIGPLEDESQIITCNVFHDRLGSLAFSALSYVWGGIDKWQEISLNGQSFRVTSNLEAYLREAARGRARKHSERITDNYIWIDALCIDQTNIPERNAQVQMMGSIYSHADQVVVWLGSGGQHIKMAMDQIRELSSIIPESGTLQAFISSDTRANLSERFINMMRDKFGTRREMFEFFRLPWWTRTWILQEAALAKNVKFLAGSETISFTDIYQAIVPFYLSILDNPISTIEALNMSDEEEVAITRFAHVVNTRAIFEHNYDDRFKSTRLQSLLTWTARAKATDPRDKIYGLLGIISDEGKDKLIPRYDLSVQQVYLKAVVWYLTQYDTLSILGQCFSGYSEDLLTLPSWVPHWEPKAVTDEGPTAFAWEAYEDFQSKLLLLPYNASGNAVLSSHNWTVSEEAGRLNLTGSYLDEITFLSDPARLSISMAQEDIFGLAKEWLALDEELGKHYPFTGESTNLALRRSMVADYHNRFVPVNDTAKVKQRNFMLMLPDDPPIESGGMRWDYKDSLMPFVSTVNKRRVAQSSEGWIGIVPETAKLGDKVVVLIGGPLLYVVRDCVKQDERQPGTDPAYSLVGEAYFHGFMDGKALKDRCLSTIALS